MIRPMRFYVFALVELVLIASCGGETKEVENSGRSDVDQYADSLRQLQVETRDRYTSGVDELLSFVTSLRDFTVGRAELAAAEGRRFVEKAGELSPPQVLGAKHEDFVSSVDSYLDNIESLPNKLREVASEEELRNLEEDAMAGIASPKRALDEACGKLQDAVRAGGSSVDFHCNEDWLFGSEAGAVDGQVAGVCGAIDPFASPNDSFTSCPDNSTEVDFGGVRGHFAAMPPLPPNLVAVSQFLVFELPEEPLALSGLALPLTEDVADPSTMAFYTFEAGDWRRVADVKAVRAGRAEGEFSSLPANMALLREVR